MGIDFKPLFAKLKGKKAKLKPLPEEPADTKATRLPKELRTELESHFGANLSKVRVHTDGNSADLCKKLNAKAFTYGQDIFLKKAGDAKDQKLLAHEMVHVLQQTNGKVPKQKKGKALVSK